MQATKAVSGTKEWASVNLNIYQGCAHDCHYCFAKAMAIRFGRKTAETWKVEEPSTKEIQKRYQKRAGRIMFPSTHDITPRILPDYLTVLEKLLRAGNDVLVVSKPHLECVTAICEVAKPYRDHVTFRFTIGTMDDGALRFWEPGAPAFAERMASLRNAFDAGFATSVSCEPLLCADPIPLVQAVQPFVTDTVWLGKANDSSHALTREDLGVTVKKAIEDLTAMHPVSRVLEIYAALKDSPKVRWKDSFKAVLGLARPTKKGLDV